MSLTDAGDQAELGAPVREGGTQVRLFLTIAVAAAFLLGVFGSATALDSISVPGGVEAMSPTSTDSNSVVCPQLVRIKYPFATCTRDAFGNVLLDAMGPKPSPGHAPTSSDFVAGDKGYWGKGH
jgi:hypothetical protein